jgi:glutathione S-transferase
METATLIVMLALAEYMYFVARVGASRGKLGVDAPACTGNDTFERIFRVQQNTLEQLIIFVPGTYAFAHYVSVKWVWIPAAMFIIGRFLYSMAYVSKPDSRAPGALMTLLANAVLVLGVLIKLGLGLF